MDVALSAADDERIEVLVRLAEAIDLTADAFSEAQGGELGLSCTDEGDAYRLTASDGSVVAEGTDFLSLAERLSLCLDRIDHCEYLKI